MDWLAGLQAAAGSSDEPGLEETVPADSQSDSDWLAGLQAAAGSSDEPGLEENTPATSQSDNDWLAGLQAAAGSSGEPGLEENAPATSQSDNDWLAGLQAAAGSSGESGPEENAPAAEDFDWMNNLEGAGQSDQAASGSLSGAEPSSGDLEGFSWDSELPSDQPASSQPAEPAETPDWLRKFEIEETPAGDAQFEPGSEPESSQSAAELPDWLNGFPSQEPEPASSEVQGSTEPTDELTPETGESVPDWLKNYAPEEQTPEASEPVAPISEVPEAEGFSWQSFGIQAEASPESASEAQESLPFAGANLPEWLDNSNQEEPRLPYDQELIPPAEPVGETKDQNPFVSGDLPDWLDESDQPAPVDQIAGELPPENDEQPLESAELPSWLQSMRPIEMVAPKGAAKEDKHVEKAGPLAGISGVLPTEDLVRQYIKPPLYSIKLRVSEKQRVHASLIENLIGEETQAQPVPADRSEAPQRVLRFLVAIVLILAILLPMLNFLPAFPEGDILPQELVAFERILSDEAAIPQNSAVLLAVEYEPGLSGEMQTASEAVIRLLAEHNTRLTIISTSPTGPILAETLLKEAGFDSARVVNLGYLAGGSTGLKSFGLAPAQAAPATLQGNLAPWNEGLLAGVSQLSDFAVVIVLTDDPDKGRNWVEQVQPMLADKPMLMVSSAQASPLLLPYYNSGQVKGIVTGISGAASLENMVGSSGTATLLRGSYQYGMLLAALLILIGGLVTGIISSITRGKAEKEA
jgi:hypothetical protein